MLKYEHEKEMPGSPLITDVFGNAWAKIYGHGELAGCWFEFNGMTVVIQSTLRRVFEGALNVTLRKAAADLVRAMEKYPSQYGDTEVELKALKRALKDMTMKDMTK